MYGPRSLTAKLRETSIKFSIRRVIATICAILTIGLFFSVSSAGLRGIHIVPNFAGQTERKTKIAAAFQHAWTGYSKHCFGHDTLLPVSNTCKDDFGGWGATAIDSLSTAIILRKEDVVLEILGFIAGLDFSTPKSGTRIQVFETVIRHFGGLLSAWDLLHGPFADLVEDEKLRQSLYEQMVELGDRLSCAFHTPSGVPYPWINPAECRGDSGNTNNVAGAGTLILEFARLSDITGNQTYVKLARKAEEYLIKPMPASSEPFPALIGSHVDIDSGEIVDSRGSWGARADSFYEYLLKAYLYNSDVYGSYLDRWLLAADSTIRFIGSHPYGHSEWTLLPSWDGTAFRNSMESLSWFAGGSFILGGMVTKNDTLVNFGLSIADTAGAIYGMTTTGLGGEFVVWIDSCEESLCDPDDSLRISDARFKLRPEVLETWYYAYRATRDPKYREWAWAAFEAINLHCRTDSGFSAIKNVNAADGGGKSDKQESFILAEVFKYIYLIHLEDDDVPYHVQDSRKAVGNRWVFNTEAHPLRVLGSPK